MPYIVSFLAILSCWLYDGLAFLHLDHSVGLLSERSVDGLAILDIVEKISAYAIAAYCLLLPAWPRASVNIANKRWIRYGACVVVAMQLLAEIVFRYAAWWGEAGGALYDRVSQALSLEPMAYAAIPLVGMGTGFCAYALTLLYAAS